MAIIDNAACPACQANGHDTHSNHLLVFADGGMYCPRSEYHLDGKPYYAKGEGTLIDDLLSSSVDGKTKYTVSQFKELDKAGHFGSQSVRALALSGMKKKDAWAVANEEEREAMLYEIQCHENYFNQLKIKNLVTRGIRGDICKLLDIRVGLDVDGKVSRHYYPVYNMDTTWRGAKCRTLPKDFGYDVLGWTWGDTLMFGQMHTINVMKKGARKTKLLLVGGECDTASALQMLYDADSSGKYHYHVWSPVHGEKAMDDILNNKAAIDEFDTIICGFDNDRVGNDMNRKIARLFRGKCKFLQYPKGCKDANQCLLEGREKEFVDAWFNPVDNIAEGMVRSVSSMSEKAKQRPEMGKSWFTKKLNAITIGIRRNMLFVIGAGSGVGKTHFTKETCFNIMEDYQEPVGVIYLEEPPIKTLRSFAGRYLGNKRIDLPPNDPDDPASYMPERDYTDEEANDAIDNLEELDLLYIADTGGDKSIEAVMVCVDDFMARGIQNIVIDNLTAITHPKAGSKVDAIDETMKAIGTYKDENDCTIFLISHLKRVGGEGSSRTPHTHGGEVYESDFRGSGAITMWANYVFGIERNTVASSEVEKRTTTIRCVKDRDFGMFTGRTVKLYGDPLTGRLSDFTGQEAVSSSDFDDGY